MSGEDTKLNETVDTERVKEITDSLQVFNNGNMPANLPTGEVTRQKTKKKEVMKRPMFEIQLIA